MTLTDYERKNSFVESNKTILTKNQMDWLTRHRETNGLADAGVLVKVSNQWYIHTAKFTEWFSKQAA